MKKIILTMLLFFSASCYSNPLSNYIQKLILFYVSDFAATIMHELGHGAVIKARGNKPIMFVGGKSRLNNDPQFINVTGLNPIIGATRNSDVLQTLLEKNDETQVNKNMLQSIIGPVFGIINLFIQSYFADKYLPENLKISLTNFISARIVCQLIYGFTPFDQNSNGDGAKLFNMLHIKYNIFKNASQYQQTFNLIRYKYFQFLFSYWIFHCLLKLIGKSQSLDSVNEKIEHSPVNSINSYIKYYIAKFLIKSGISEAKKRSDDENIKKSNYWEISRLIEPLIF